MAEASPGEAGKEKPPISDILERIKQAEAKSRSIVKEAEAQKERTIAEAKREAISIREQAVKEIEFAVDQITRETAARIDIDRKRIFESADVRAGKVRSQAGSRMEQAKELLLKDFMRAIDDQA